MTTPGRSFVELCDVSKSYRLGDGSILKAIDALTLHVKEHETLAIMGPSGSGKSTLLHLVGALDRPDSGTITVDGTSLETTGRKALAGYRSRIGFVFQRFHLIPTLTVKDNVLAPLIPRKVDFDRQERAHELIAAVGMRGREDSVPAQLSGGQQQRTAIARALINHPKLLLADEPTGNLDSTTASEVIDLLLKLNREQGTTIMMATHDEAIAERFSRTVHVRDGQLTGR